MSYQADDSLLLPDNNRSRADAVRNHRLLLDTARRLFHAQGVDAVSMTQIAQEAGVGKGTLYRNFENKIDLCYALLDEDQRLLQEDALARFRSSQDPAADLRWFLPRVAQFVMDNLPLLCAGSDSLQTVSLAQPAHLWWRQSLRHLLERAGAAGDLDYLADSLYVMLHVDTIRFQVQTLSYAPQRVIDGLHLLLDRLLPG